MKIDYMHLHALSLSFELNQHKYNFTAQCNEAMFTKEKVKTLIAAQIGKELKND